MRQTQCALMRRRSVKNCDILRRTSAAQQALRRTMEIYSSTTRFALACNNSSQIIEPIQSRCAILRYVRLSNVQMLKRLMTVCSAEGVDCSDEGSPRSTLAIFLPF